MKVRVSGLVWVPKTSLGDSIPSLRKSLTIVPRKTMYDTDKPTPVKCFGETIDEFGFPRDYFFSTAVHNHDVTWALCDGHPTNYESLITQEGDYAEQGKALDVLEGWFGGFESQLALDGPIAAGKRLGGILNADPAFGKTNVALALAHRIGTTALIIVHKEFLMKQWVKRIHQFMPDAKVGIVREDKCQFEGMDFVIAMVQSLAMEGADGKRRYPLDFYNWPGQVYLDEVHRIGALTWSPAPRMFPARVRVGLSATLRRRDGADKVFWWHIGAVQYKATTKRPILDVRMVESNMRGPDFIHTDQVSPSTVVNIMVKQGKRNQLIVREIVKALKSPHKRKIMILSERLEHLRELDVILARAVAKEKLEDVTTGFYVGQWFTGEITKVLTKRGWEMDDEGREAAVAKIYTSMSRKRPPRAYKDADGGRILKLEDGDLDLDELLLMDQQEGMDADVAKIERAAADAAIFGLAKDLGIAQKAVEKKKKRTDEELDKAEQSRVIWATYQMCSEGVSIDSVDTLGFATPISDIEQTYGRGRRVCVPVRHGGDKPLGTCKHLCPWRWETCTGKPKGIAFDIIDDRIPMPKRRKGYRLEFYDAVKAKVSGAGS